MPDVTVTFTLPDEDEEFRLHIDGPRFANACAAVDDRCRAFIKWSESPSEDAVRLAEEIRGMVREVLWR